MIKIKDGHARSERTEEEEEALLKRELETLTDAERATLELVLQELKGASAQQPADSKLLDFLGSAEYKTPPVDIRTFVKDHYYLGVTCDSIYPKLLDDLIELFEGGNYTEAVMSGSVGYGKTFFASVGICRVLYEISCMRDPHASFGLAKDTNIAITCFSVNEDLARKVAYENIVTKLKASPYFQEHFPFTPTKKEVRFPNNIWLAPRATTDTSALGLNTVSAFIDEGNFLENIKSRSPESKAENLYTQVKRRIKSRFERRGKLPGMLFIVSSKRTDEDFTAKRIQASINDPTIFVRDYALWDVRPEEYFHAKKFKVLCGNAETSSKILTPEEIAKFEGRDAPEGCVIIDVPEDFRRDFEQNIEDSIRDLAGVATVAIRPFIQRREKIKEAIDPTMQHPFSTEVYDMSKGGVIMWDRLVKMKSERAPGRVEFQRLRPIINPHAARHVHIDIGLRKDALGLGMAHISGWKDVIRRSDDGREFVDRAPTYIVDFVLRVIPPMGGEIILSDVRHLVYDLSAHGFMITSVTLDSFQSTDSIQLFAAKGYKSSVISVDTTPVPYDMLKTALYENRIRMYPYAPLQEELTFLQEDYSRGKRKIDHPPHKSKDISDALAAVTYTLSQQKLVEPLPILRSLPYSGDVWMEEQKQALLAGNTLAGGNTNLLPPFLLGSGGDDDDGSPWRP